MPSRPPAPLLLSVILFAGTLACIVFGCWIFFTNPFKPTVVEKTVIVEKTPACPPAKSGAATTRGQQSPAVTGSGNTVTVGQPTQPPTK